MSHKKWVVRSADSIRVSEIREKFNIDTLVAHMLVSRGIDDDLTVSKFLSGSFEAVSPFNFADMEDAAFTIGDAIDYGEKICVYGDYDCDGVTSTALLLSYLREQGADAFAYIPDRLSEGYGLNIDAVRAIKEQGADLIVTVDNGINSVEEAKLIYELGMRLVITDHHQLGDEMPKAEAVVNPHRDDNDLEFREYCGVGVAFKLVCAMEESDDYSHLIDKYIDLVAIGTIADVVPLVGENRSFVKLGIDKINNSPRPSLVPFVNTANGKKFSANDIAFQLCPRINATGRMGSAMEAVDFLMCTDAAESGQRYNTLVEQNTLRQNTEREILKSIEEQIAESPKLAAERVIVIAQSGYHSGVIGIVASHVVERYGKPAFVIGIDDDGIARGSARSVDGFNLFEAISACSDDLIKFGGHPLAAGVTLAADKIDDFRRDINAYALEKYDIMPAITLNIDCKLSPHYFTLDLLDSISVLEPYGAENPSPVFGVYNATLVSTTALSEGKHTRLDLEKKGFRFKVVKFGVSPADLPYKSGDRLNLALRVSKNIFRGETYLSLQAVDICLASIDDDKYFKEKNDYELYRLKRTADKSLYPDRNVCALIYKYLRSNGGYNYSIDDLYFRLQSSVTYGQLCIALKAFSQAGLISFGGSIKMLETNGKADLENTPALKALKGRINGD